MPSYQAPTNDFKFLLHDFLQVENYTALKSFREASPDLMNAIIEEGAKLTENVMQPLNMSGDEEGCHWKDGVVTTPKGFKEAYQLYIDGGWQSLTGDPQYGGQGLPQISHLIMYEMLVSANWGFTMYTGLTKSAIDTIHAHGTKEQKQLYLPKMLTGEWPGTMNLTESHCGTDLGLMRTRAICQEDGSYKITGTKIFISAGEQDLTENIVHLVLARTPDAPKGTKGISLFLVPKFLVSKDGGMGEKNNIYCASIENKMGIHASATCVLNYDGAWGQLIGEENNGMKAMFTMMNEARLSVALQGLAIAEVAQQNAVAYTQDRLAGRALGGAKFPDQPADPIIVHPDVRRMLMSNRAFIEGARAFALWIGLQIDIARDDPDEMIRQKADDLVTLLTPVMKAYMTDQGVEATSRALQCFGGHGYIKEWGMEQFYRDARIAPIYEGANGVQAMDLVGRKIHAKNGRLLNGYISLLGDFIDQERGNLDLENYIEPLKNSLEHLETATQWLREQSVQNPDHTGAAAYNYLNLLALLSMGYIWTQLAKTAHRKLAEGCENHAFMRNKLITADFFFTQILPDTSVLLAKVTAGADSVMALDANAF